jgi:prepilin-type N-terminal cleavage/methylation domain-containing protein
MKINRKSKGFTIIEVVLVLAIAGLIFMMVFIAVPAMSRSANDLQRKKDLTRLNQALTSYQSNNNGKLPSTVADWNGFVTGYVRTAGDTFVDPSGTDYVVSTTATLPTTFVATNPVIKVTTPGACNGEDVVTTGQSVRKVAFQMKLEGSGTACMNN